jgi:hypothetical protein
MKYVCSTCKQEKDESAFGVCNTYATGRNPRCKQCCNAAAKRVIDKKKLISNDLLTRIADLEERMTNLEPVVKLVTLMTAEGAR